MKALILALVLSVSTLANSKVQSLFDILKSADSYSHELMWNSGRIGELHTDAHIYDTDFEGWIDKREILSAIDDEVKRMITNDDLFRHDNEKIESLFDLLSSEFYDVTFKTGHHSRNGEDRYASDGIEEDFLKLFKTYVRDEIIWSKYLKGARYGYLRTWNTDSEYDGLERFFILFNKKMIIVSINNCGGC